MRLVRPQRFNRTPFFAGTVPPRSLEIRERRAVRLGLRLLVAARSKPVLTVLISAWKVESMPRMGPPLGPELLAINRQHRRGEKPVRRAPQRHHSNRGNARRVQ